MSSSLSASQADTLASASQLIGDPSQPDETESTNVYSQQITMTATNPPPVLTSTTTVPITTTTTISTTQSSITTTIQSTSTFANPTTTRSSSIRILPATSKQQYLNEYKKEQPIVVNNKLTQLTPMTQQVYTNQLNEYLYKKSQQNQQLNDYQSLPNGGCQIKQIF